MIIKIGVFHVKNITLMNCDFLVQALYLKIILKRGGSLPT